MAYEVVKLKEKRVVGIKVATTMEKAARDCPALWMTFGPRMRKELVPLDILNPSGESYGVSVMTSKTGFDYWAAVEVVGVREVKILPQGMAMTIWPAGDYVRTQADGLADLNRALAALYNEWPVSQHVYDIKMAGVSVEVYQANWTPQSQIAIYASVEKKGKP